VESSSPVTDGLRAWYEAFNTGDPERFGERISQGAGVSVIGTAPGEGHEGHDGWVQAYRDGIAEAGLKLEPGDSIRGWEEDETGFALDDPSFVLPNGGRLPTRLTAVLHKEDGEWKVVHLHFSVGVPDEEAVQMPEGG
jgi:hypothetical protein